MKVIISIISAILSVLTLTWGYYSFEGENAQGDNLQEVSQAYIKRVIDSDTYVAVMAHGEDRIRLARVDAPEAGTVEGDRATEHIRPMIEHKTLRIEYLGRGYYDRAICEVFIDDSTNLSDWLVANGLAQYKDYPPPKK